VQFKRKNRKNEEIRKTKLEMGTISSCDGSCTISTGNNTIIVSVRGPNPAPRWNSDPQRGVVSVNYNMLSFGVKDRKRPGPDRRSTEISEMLRNVANNVILLHKYPNCIIEIFVDIVLSDGSTRCTAINALGPALIDAGIEIKGIPVSCSVGVIEGEQRVDIDAMEDMNGEVDCAIAYSDHTLEEISLFQNDGKIPYDDLDSFIQMSKKACSQFAKKQIEEIERYSKKTNQKYIRGENNETKE